MQVGRSGEKAKKAKWDRPTDGPTDRQTDRVGHRVACTRLKTERDRHTHKHTKTVEDWEEKEIQRDRLINKNRQAVNVTAWNAQTEEHAFTNSFRPAKAAFIGKSVHIALTVFCSIKFKFTYILHVYCQSQYTQGRSRIAPHTCLAVGEHHFIEDWNLTKFIDGFSKKHISSIHWLPWGGIILPKISKSDSFQNCFFVIHGASTWSQWVVTIKKIDFNTPGSEQAPL